MGLLVPTDRRLRIGIDTGGTFTDVVAFDEVTGTLAVTKTPSTPADPAQGFLAGLAKVLDLAAAGPGDVAAVSHGTTIATNQLLEGKIGRLGFITTEGFEFLLEIARQSVPDGYGNSYFWVKPDRIVPPDRVRVVARPDRSHRGGAAPVRRGGRDRGRAFLRGQRDRHDRRLLPARLRQPGARASRCANVLAREHPAALVSLSARGAARVPRVRAGDDDAGRRRGQAGGRRATSTAIAAGLGR